MAAAKTDSISDLVFGAVFFIFLCLPSFQNLLEQPRQAPSGVGRITFRVAPRQAAAACWRSTWTRQASRQSSRASEGTLPKRGRRVAPRQFGWGFILAQALLVCMHACMSHFSSGPFWLRHCMHVCMHACPILAQGQFGSGSVCMYACMSHFASGAFWLRHCMDVCMHACPVLAWRNFGSGTVSMYACMHVPFWVGAI